MRNTVNTNSIFDQLALDASRTFKIDFLRQNASNLLLKECVRLALDPMTQFYIRKIPAYTPNNCPGGTLWDALRELEKLSSSGLNGHAGIAHLKSILEFVNASDALVIVRIIEKDLRCGVSTSTVNDVWPDLVIDYPVMLCSPYEDKLVARITYPAIFQTKMDGMRFNAVVRRGKVDFHSRNGKELFLLGNLEQEFIALANGQDMVFDGELVVYNPASGKFFDRKTGNGILNKANKGTISAKDAAFVHASVWDMIPYNDFLKGKCSTGYAKRWVNLNQALLGKGNTKVHLVKTWTVHSLDEARMIFEELLANGEEGGILKDSEGPWENKRARHQIKFKGEEECDLLIVGIEPGTGKYEGMLGALVCESRDGLLKVSVGSGLNVADRQSIGSEVIGKVVAVKYNQRVTSKTTGTVSLFLPIFVEIRDDKTMADKLSMIK